MTDTHAERAISRQHMSGVVRCGLVLAVFVAAIATGACTASWSHRPIVVQLEPVADTVPARWSGMTNIFFDSVPPSIRDSVRLGHDWTGVELADVVRGDDLVTVYAARFAMLGTGQTHYVIATAGSMDFAASPFLTFTPHNGIAVANLDIEVRAQSGTHRRVPYQILRSEDGYTYARIANYVSGSAHLRGRDYPVRVRHASRSDPFYTLDKGTRYWIAPSADDTITEQARITTSGAAVPSDEVFLGTPFKLQGRPYQLAEIDSAGSRLVLRPSTTQVAAAAGFVAPALTGKLLSGRTFRLSDNRRRVVLLEFWSIDCHFSELARPRLNDLAAQLRSAPFSWVAIAREDDSAVVQQHLADHPMSATVALRDSAAWAIYDPAIATPLFFVIDQTGVVRFRAVGTSAVDVVAAKIAELLAPAPHPHAAR